MLQDVFSLALNTLFGFLMFQIISGNFSQIFEAFGVFFAAQKSILSFSKIILILKFINSENNKNILFFTDLKPYRYIYARVVLHVLVPDLKPSSQAATRSLVHLKSEAKVCHG